MSCDEAATAGVVDALRTVRDPELDESIVDLGFVTEARVEGGRAAVRLRLPTYFCAPNFAFLMVADAHDAVRRVDGIQSVSVLLEDHFAAEAINSGVADGAGFAGSFPGEATGELSELRRTFRRKAHTAAMERCCRQLIKSGWTTGSLPRARLADLPEGRERDSLLRRRKDLDLPTSPDSPVLLDDTGAPVAAEHADLQLRRARTVGLGIEANAHICRSLLTTRYPESAAAQRPREFTEAER